jgi:hypothetical protein
MPMMQIGVMGMSVNQWGMTMPVAMRLAGWIGRGVHMLMVGIVTMLHCIMDVLVIVPLCQVQPQSKAHQAASDQQPCR